VRVGARVAGRLATNWYAVYVTKPEDDKGHGDPEAFQRLQEYSAWRAIWARRWFRS
jgi:two-component system sensor histidine kinase KdpD